MLTRRTELCNLVGKTIVKGEYMQKTSIRFSIFSGMALILIAILSIFGFGRINSVKAANNLGDIEVSIITVDNATNGFISKRDKIDNIDKEDTPITLDSYTELVGAEIRRDEGEDKLFLLGSSIGITPQQKEGSEIKYYPLEDESGEIIGYAYKSTYLNKIIYFKTQKIALKITNINTTITDGTTTSFSFVYNDKTYSQTKAGELTDTINALTVNLPLFGDVAGTISNKGDGTTADWVSTTSFETHEALLLQVGENSSTVFDINSFGMTLNNEEIDSNGRVYLPSRGSYYHKEYHGIPASVIDECGINVAAKTGKTYGSTSPSNFLNSLEGYYKFTIKYLVNTIIDKTATFNFYLMTSNTYANTDEILTFYNAKTVEASESDDEYTKYHHFNHNNIDNTKLLDIVSPTTIGDGYVIDDTGFTYNTVTYVDDFFLPSAGSGSDVNVKNIYNAYSGFGTNNAKGIIYQDGQTKKWMFTDRLLYPTITFNPEKYSISYDRTWYNITESGSFEFETLTNLYLDGLYGVMSVYTTDITGVKTLKDSFWVARKTNELAGATNIVIDNTNPQVLLSLTYDATNYVATNGLVTIDEKQYYYNQVEKKVCEYNTDAPYIAKYQFDELGEYDFMQKYKLKISENVYYETDSISASTNISSKNEKLYINGYQATYRQNGTTTSYLRNENYVSDFSYLVKTPVYKKDNSEAKTTIKPTGDVIDSSTITEEDGYYKITFDSCTYYVNQTTVTSTNQAPVALRYLATPNNQAIGNSTYLWYLHQNSKGQISVYNYTNSKSFSTAGLYVVFLSFVDSSNTKNCCEQVIAFKITNSQPEVSLQITESNNISNLTEKGNNPIASNSYTNKNVFIQWLNNDVFNSEIYATYTQYDFDGKVVRRGKVNGLIYYKTDSHITNQNTTLFTENGRYVISIFYTNTGSSISRSFVIDRTSIDGIKAIAINTTDGSIFGSKEAGTTLNDAILSDQNNFNLVVHSSFAWTWNSKASGAGISAKYYYSNISAKTSYSLDSLAHNEELWVVANGEFGELLTGTEYAHTPISAIDDTSSEAKYWKAETTKFDSSQIISTNCMAILVLSDEAGNTACFVTIYDSVVPQTIQQKAGSNQTTTTTLISGTTQFIWGSHKAISVATTAASSLKIGEVFDGVLKNTSAELTFTSSSGTANYALTNSMCEQIRDTFKYQSSTNLYYTLPIKNATVKMDGASYTLTPQKLGGQWINTSCYVVLQEMDGEMKTYISRDQNSGGRISNIISLEEHPQITLQLDTTDKQGNATTLVKNISLDQSDGRIFSHSGSIDTSAISDTTTAQYTQGDPEKMRTANRQQIFDSYKTNRDFLTFSFLQQPSGTFRVESIKLEYYELNPSLTMVLNETTNEYEPNPTYPYNTKPLKSITLYSTNPSDTVVKNITWNDHTLADSEGYSGTYMQSSEINLASNGLTAPGKYVFIRKYEQDVSSMDSSISKHDKTYFEYTVYVDRNGVITEDLSLNLGSQGLFDNYSDDETYKVFKNFSNQKQAADDFRGNYIYDDNVSIIFNKQKTTLPATDILPAKIGLKILGNIAFKYYYPYENGSYADQNGSKYNVSTQSNSDLIIIVQKFNTTSTPIALESQTLYSSVVTQKHNPSIKQQSAPMRDLTSQTFSGNGIYRVFIMDLCNINMQLTDQDFVSGWAKSILGIWDSNLYNDKFTPNVATFSFTLGKEEISVSALIKNTNVDTYTSLTQSRIGNEDYYYTQNNNVIFSFSDTSYEYKAKVQYKDWSLTRTIRALVNGTIQSTIDAQVSPRGVEIRTYNPSNEEANRDIFSENEINRIKGISDNTVSTMRFSTKDEEGGILYYRVKLNGTSDDRYTYYIILPASVSSSGTDCIYSLSLSYLADARYYSDRVGSSTNTYYSKTIQAYIDKTAPYKNVLALIEQDTYLSQAQKSDMKANLNNPNYRFMQYYAFAVGTSYSPNQNLDVSEKIDHYYYKQVTQKYSNDSTNSNQVVIPENEEFKNSSNKFDETTLSKKRYGEALTASVDGAGYYDIIEVDKAGNHRVYTIYLNGSEGGVQLNASATNANNTSYAYTFLSSFTGDIPFYNITSVSNDIAKDIYTKNGTIDYSNLNNIPSISAASFVIDELIIKDEWYSINYSLINGATSAAGRTITVAPQVYSSITGETYNTKEQNLAILNDFILNCIENGKLANGARIEIEFVNRGGNNLRFYLLTPGNGLSISNLSPTIVGNRYFTITIPADSYSTKYSGFRVTQNSVVIQSDNNSPATYISSLEMNRDVPTSLRFILGNYRYAISFGDNFGRSYEFIYPTTEGIVNELVFEDGTQPKFVDGILYASNTATFKYTTGTRDQISIKIIDKDINETIVNLENMEYTSTSDDNNVKTQLEQEDIKMYMSESLNMSTSIVSIKFNAIKNRHLYYEITLLDIDNNTHVRNFALYTYAPTITLTDNVGIELFNKDSSDKITSKTVVVRYGSNSSYLFNPQIKLFDGTNTSALASSTQIKNPGDYQIFVENELGTMNVFEINFTIKPATTDIYSVYFADELLTAHTVKYPYETGLSKKLIDSYFFLSGANNAWSDIKILPSEDKDLTTELIDVVDNTKIYKIFGSAYEDYFAITQIFPVANNHLTTFNIQITTDLVEYSNSTVGSGDHQYTIEPTNGKTVYAKILWDSTEAGFQNFVYAKIWYNTVYMGTFNEDVVLTQSGQYRIQIFDIVGQQHRFGSQGKEEFSLTILNNINFYINKATPIENQTFNEDVTLSLINTDKYAWRNGGFITVLKNNQEFFNYETNGTSWTFREAGYYSIYLETPIASNTAAPIRISATAHFTILDKNESKSVYDFAKISGYSVTKIERIDYNSDLAELINLIQTNYNTIDSDSSYSEQVLTSFKQYNEKIITDNNITNVTELANYLSTINTNTLLYTYTDMTETLKAMLETEALQSFKITPDNLGVGRYQIHVRVEANEISTSLSYSYEVWINNEEPTLNSSRAFGSSSTSSFTISYNPSIIYNQVGNSYIMINDAVVATIDANSQSENYVRTYRVSSPGTYLIQVYSQSGSLISSQRITINVPLNTAAIILIVVAVAVAVGIVVIFIMLRTKMKVK